MNQNDPNPALNSESDDENREATGSISRLRQQRTAWEALWKEHLRKVDEDVDWSLEERLESWAHLDREYKEMKAGGETPSPSGSEKAISSTEFQDKRYNEELETYQALGSERQSLNDRLVNERDTTIHAWRSNWDQQREERSSTAGTPEANLKSLEDQIETTLRELAAASKKAKNLQDQLAELKASEQDAEQEQAQNIKIAQMRDEIAPLAAGVDQGGFTDEQKKQFMDLSKDLEDALRNKPQRRQADLQAQLSLLRGSVESWFMAGQGTLETLRQKLRGLREGQIAIMRDLQHANLGNVENQASQELFEQLWAGHALRREWLEAQAQLMESGMMLLAGEPDLDDWTEPVIEAASEATASLEREKAFADKLRDAEAKALYPEEGENAFADGLLDAEERRALEAEATAKLREVEQFAATQTGGVIGLFEEEQGRPQFREVLGLLQRWNGRSVLGARDLRQLEEDADTYEKWRIDALSSEKQTLSECRLRQVERRERLNEKTKDLEAELTDVTPQNNWRRRFLNGLSNVSKKFNDNIEELQEIVDGVAERLANMQVEPFNLEGLRLRFIEIIRFDSETGTQFGERIQDAIADAEWLNQVESRFDRQQERHVLLQEIWELDGQMENRIREAHEWGSISLADFDRYRATLPSVRGQLEIAEANMLQILDRLSQDDDMRLRMRAEPLDRKLDKLRADLDGVSDELNRIELNSHRKALLNAAQGAAAIEGLSLKFRGTIGRITEAEKIVIKTQPEEQSDPLTKEILNETKAALDDLEQVHKQAVALMAETSKWIRDAEAFCEGPAPTDVDGERAQLLRARDLIRQRQAIEDAYARLAKERMTFASKATLLERQVMRLPSVANTEKQLKEKLAVASTDSDVALSQALEERRAALMGRLQECIDDAGELRGLGLAFCSQFFAADDDAAADLARTQKASLPSFDQAQNELDSTLDELARTLSDLQTDVENERRARATALVEGSSGGRPIGEKPDIVAPRPFSQELMPSLDERPARSGRFSTLKAMLSETFQRDRRKDKEKQQENSETAGRKSKLWRLFTQKTDDPGVESSTSGVLSDADRLNMQEINIDPSRVRDVEAGERVGIAVLQLENKDFVYTLNNPIADRHGKSTATGNEFVIVPQHVVKNAGRLPQAESQLRDNTTDATSFIVSATLLKLPDVSQDPQPGKRKIR